MLQEPTATNLLPFQITALPLVPKTVVPKPVQLETELIFEYATVLTPFPNATKIVEPLFVTAFPEVEKTVVPVPNQKVKPFKDIEIVFVVPPTTM